MNLIKFSNYLLLAGAFLVVPVLYDLFKGKGALIAVLKDFKNKTDRITAVELFFASLMSYEVVWLIMKIYLMIIQLPLSTKW